MSRDRDGLADGRVSARIRGKNGDLEPGALEVAVQGTTASGKSNCIAVVAIDNCYASTFSRLEATQWCIHVQCCHHWGWITIGIIEGQAG